MSAFVSKEDAHRLGDQLPAYATWDDLMYEIYSPVDSGWLYPAF